MMMSGWTECVCARRVLLVHSLNGVTGGKAEEEEQQQQEEEEDGLGFAVDGLLVRACVCVNSVVRSCLLDAGQRSL